MIINLINIKNIDLVEQASKGARVIGASAFSMLGGNINKKLTEEKTRKIADGVHKLLKERKKMSIPDVMEAFDVNVAEAIEAVKILKQRGIIQEID